MHHENRKIFEKVTSLRSRGISLISIYLFTDNTYYMHIFLALFSPTTQTQYCLFLHPLQGIKSEKCQMSRAQCPETTLACCVHRLSLAKDVNLCLFCISCCFHCSSCQSAAACRMLHAACLMPLEVVAVKDKYRK